MVVKKLILKYAKFVVTDAHLQLQIGTQNERKHKSVLGQKGPGHIVIQLKCEVVTQITQTSLNNL